MSNWVVDQSHTNINFSVRHMMVSKVKGVFEDFDAKVQGNPEDFVDGNVSVTIQTASINTNNEDRDNHLRSADFFDVENHPEITFNTTNIVKTGNDEYDITGDLTIGDVTKQQTFAFSYNGTGKNPWGVTVVGFEGETKLSRKEYGLTWNQALETGGVLVGDEITITIEGQLNPAE